MNFIEDKPSPLNQNNFRLLMIKGKLLSIISFNSNSTKFVLVRKGEFQGRSLLFIIYANKRSINSIIGQHLIVKSMLTIKVIFYNLNK